MANVAPAFKGWRLTATLGAAVLAMAAAIVLTHGADANGIRCVIRATGRTSFVLFTLAFSASSLAQFAPNRFTLWQYENRRHLGLSFAASHGVHGAALIALFSFHPVVFGELVGLSMLILGGIGYACIGLIASASFASPGARIGSRAWQALQTVAGTYVWGVFVNSFRKRAGETPLYWFPVVVLAVVMLIRVSNAVSRRRDGLEASTRAPAR